MNRIITAAALGVVVWGLARWLHRRYVPVRSKHSDPTESWENEGGSVSSPAWMQSSPPLR